MSARKGLNSNSLIGNFIRSDFVITDQVTNTIDAKILKLSQNDNSI